MLNKGLRKRIIEQGMKYHHGHYGSAFSCLDAIKYLYDNILEKNDNFILSKGHGYMALQVVLEERGKKVNWKLNHPDYDPDNGIDALTGSLGHGLAIGAGRAYGKKLKGEDGNVYVLLGDGEIQGGPNWEALILAKKLGLTNLVPIIDWNKYQAIGSVKDVVHETEETLVKKLNAFGFFTTVINGHKEDSLSTFKYLRENLPNKLNAVILNTQKGYGMKFLEEHPSVHVLFLNEKPEVYKQTLEDLTDDN